MGTTRVVTMSEELLKKISKQLDQLLALNAINLVKGMKPTESILALGSAGLDRNLIAQVTASTPATVSVRLSEAKAKKKPVTKKGPRKPTNKR
jgi:hypothetical protein